MARVTGKHSHTAYVGLQKSLQQKWDFMQRVTPDIGMAFQTTEDALRNAFLLAILKGATFQIPGRAFTGIPSK